MDGFEKWLTKEVDKCKNAEAFVEYVEAYIIRNKYYSFKRGEKL